MDREQRARDWFEEEEKVRERIDAQGRRWRKVYLGGGEHLRNWLSQCRELAGEENVELERVEASPLACFEPGGEALYRIWVREGAERD